MDAFENVVPSVAALREIYREPHRLVTEKKVTDLTEPIQRFIASSPFCLLATSNEAGHCDVSPRGGPPGFVRTLDDHRIVIPDLTGNNLIDSLSNIVANAHAGLLFVIPGRDETLRLEGKAVLTTDPSLLALWDDELRTPKVAIGVEVGTAYMHCAKAFRRGRVWDADSWDELDAPDACELLPGARTPEITKLIRDALDEGYVQALAEEKA
jgi:PPOX class probable FMN-dependent enzyme